MTPSGRSQGSCGAAFQRREGWAAELGDVFFALICVANASEVDLGTALNEIMEKYARRLTETGRPDSGK